MMNKQLEYYYSNREERIAYQKEYQKRKRKRYNKYQQEYYQKNKEHLIPQRYFYLQAKRDAVKETKRLPQYKLNEIERVLKKKLKEIRKAEKLIYSAARTFRGGGVGGVGGGGEKDSSEAKNSAPRIYDKYYQNKLMKKYQHSLPQSEPFSDIIVTKDGFTLTW
jgi:hypothetical protein